MENSQNNSSDDELSTVSSDDESPEYDTVNVSSDEDLSDSYVFKFFCPKCKDVLTIKLKRSSYSGFSYDGYGQAIYSCPGVCQEEDVCMKCAPKRSSANSLYCDSCC